MDVLTRNWLPWLSLTATVATLLIALIGGISAWNNLATKTDIRNIMDRLDASNARHDDMHIRYDSANARINRNASDIAEIVKHQHTHDD